MHNHLHRTRRAAAPVPTSMVTMVTTVTAAVTMAYLMLDPLVSGADRQLRRRVTDRRDRGALSLEQAILTGILAGAAIALGALIYNAIQTHAANVR